MISKVKVKKVKISKGKVRKEVTISKVKFRLK
jgi:hypothetical protein